MTLAHRRAAEFVRATQSDPHPGAPDPGAADAPQAGLIDIPSMREECGQLARGLAALTESQREAVLMACFGGSTYREAAKH